MRKIGLLIVGLLLAGCGGGGNDESAAATEDPESVFDPMTDQIDKAKAVEDQAMQHKEDIDSAVQQAGDTAADIEDEVDDPVE